MADRLKPSYIAVLLHLEKLHRQLLDLIKDEFDRMEWYDINPTQALMLFSMGKNEIRAGDFRKFGHYFGSNVSYNLSKLETLGYLKKAGPKKDDRRVVRVSVTGKGEEVAEVVDELLARHCAPTGEITSDIDQATLDGLNAGLAGLGHFWTVRRGMAALVRPGKGNHPLNERLHA